MATGEIRNRQYRNLMDQTSQLYSDFHASLDKLRAMADDFSDGSQQRWMVVMRKCSALRDLLWDLRQKS